MANMAFDPRREYLRQGVMTASPAELVVMLFSACIKNLKLAVMAYEESKDVCATHNCLMKAQKIIGELLSSLDMSYEISSQLEKIYGFMLAELREVNIRKDMSRLDPIIRMLESMRDTWQIVAQQQRKKLVGA